MKGIKSSLAWRGSFLLTLVATVFPVFTVTTPAWATATGPTIKVMTLNLHNGRDLQGRDNLQRFLALLAKEEPDLVALQEVERRHLAALQSTGWNVVAGFNANRPDFRFGNVVMTPHRIVYERHHYLPGELEQRGLNEVAVEVDGRYFYVLNTHLGLSRVEREGQMAEILRIADYLQGPLLLTGDFNVGSYDGLFTMLPPGFAEAGNVFDLPNTFPLSNPRHRIDLIWFSPDWEPVSGQVLPWAHSDHFPVTAELRLKTGAGVRTAEPTPVRIPAYDWQYHPVLPDVGRRSGAAEFSFRVAGKSHGLSSVRLTVPIWSALSFTGVVTRADPASGPAEVRDETRLIVDYYFKELDFRDYFSLLGFRGKAEFSLFAESAPEQRGAFGLKQYYRWNNRLGTSVTTGFSDKFFWAVEGAYLPTERIGWQLKVDREGDFSTGISYTVNKHLVITTSYSLSTEKLHLTLGFY